MTNPLKRLNELGQSPWYDYITRELLNSGELRQLIADDGLKGMTSNPTIFEKAITGSDLYDEDIARLASQGKSATETFEAIAVADVRNACDTFRPVFDTTRGWDGLVSIEVNPALARDTEGTIAEARRLWESVNRPNVMVKIPGTKEGLPAIERSIADGLNINVTLLFSVQRYEEVIDAYLSGLERRLEAGEPIDGITSVASFFVSRIDVKVDPMLDEMDDPEGIRGKIAIANACTAYGVFERNHASSRWKELEKQGARAQRPLWASTSTKDPSYPDVYYVDALVAPNTVNTVPPHTFAAYRDHGDPEVRIYDGMAAAPEYLDALARVGIDLSQVTSELEDEGVEKFATSYDSVVEAIAEKRDALEVHS